MCFQKERCRQLGIGISYNVVESVTAKLTRYYKKQVLATRGTSVLGRNNEARSLGRSINLPACVGNPSTCVFIRNRQTRTHDGPMPALRPRSPNVMVRAAGMSHTSDLIAVREQLNDIHGRTS